MLASHSRELRKVSSVAASRDQPIPFDRDRSFLGDQKFPTVSKGVVLSFENRPIETLTMGC
jgi:hypothetical protein